MARWKTLPEGLDPIVVQLVVELRRMKDDSGLSLNRLAKRTGYSASSWERYLGGRAFPPEEAVRALIGVTGADETNLIVLYQTAQQSWAATAADDDPQAESGSSNTSEPSAPSEATRLLEPVDSAISAPSHQTPASTTFSSRLPPPRVIANSLASALVGAAVAVLVLQPWHHDKAVSAVTHPAAKATAPVHYTCTYTQSKGKWYAGNSTTDRTQVDDGMAGPDVAEVQCLLQHAGISPGGIDGDFGPKTLHAVIQEQLAHHLDVDGQVGPQTWAALRG